MKLLAGEAAACLNATLLQVHEPENQIWILLDKLQSVPNVEAKLKFKVVQSEVPTAVTMKSIVAFRPTAK
jgi:hypothetical protein